MTRTGRVFQFNFKHLIMPVTKGFRSVQNWIRFRNVFRRGFANGDVRAHHSNAWQKFNLTHHWSGERTLRGIYEWEIVNEISSQRHSETTLNRICVHDLSHVYPKERPKPVAHEIQWEHVRHHVWSALWTSAIVSRIFVLSTAMPKREVASLKWHYNQSSDAFKWGNH